MKYSETTGNIWSLHQAGAWVVIPTNGFVKNNGNLVMGAGLARQAHDRFMVAQALGQAVLKNGNHVQCNPAKKLISFPTKHHWTELADPVLIEASMAELVELAGFLCVGLSEIALPRVGCGNGKLEWDAIKPLFDNYLDDRFVLVNPIQKFGHFVGQHPVLKPMKYLSVMPPVGTSVDEDMPF